MILMPGNAFSISLCTRSTSDLRNVCSCRSSDESLSSPSIEFEVKRTTEDMILSASTSIWVSGFEILFSTKLPLSASPSDKSDFSAGAAEDDGEEFIGISSKREFEFNSCLKPNDISNLVNNCLAELPQMIRQILGRRCARRCLWGRPPQTKRSSVPAAMDRLAPKRSATGPAARQRLLPDVEIGGGEASWWPLPPALRRSARGPSHLRKPAERAWESRTKT